MKRILFIRCTIRCIIRCTNCWANSMIINNCWFLNVFHLIYYNFLYMQECSLNFAVYKLFHTRHNIVPRVSSFSIIYRRKDNCAFMDRLHNMHNLALIKQALIMNLKDYYIETVNIVLSMSRRMLIIEIRSMRH